jgi:hypothetical protein
MDGGESNIFGSGNGAETTNKLVIVLAILVVICVVLLYAMRAYLQNISKYYTPVERMRPVVTSEQRAATLKSLNPGTVFERMQHNKANTTRARLATKFDTFAANPMVAPVVRALKSENANSENFAANAASRGLSQAETARQLRGGLSQENFAANAAAHGLSQAETARQLRGGLSRENFDTARDLVGGLSREKFSGLPMLGGGKLTDGATALRAADPVSSEPVGPSERQYMKENELLEHLLYE